MKRMGYKNAIGIDIDGIDSIHSFKEGSFDLVCSYRGLEHTTNPQETLNELYRILKSGGLLFIIVPILKEGGFGRADFLMALVDEDLKVIEYSIKSGHNLLAEIWMIGEKKGGILGSDEGKIYSPAYGAYYQ